MTRNIALLIAILSPAAALADDATEVRDFARIDQTGGLGGGEVATAYSLEATRAVAAVEGSTERGAYRGVTHRLAAAYGILDWLTVGFDQSIRQQELDSAQLGMFSPIVRGRIDLLGVPVPGLGIYAQGRIRVSGRRPDALVGGVSYDRELGGVHLAGVLGYERTVGPQPAENGFRSEIGVARKLGDDWLFSAEAWGHGTWRLGTFESSAHLGPSLQRRIGPVNAGLQLATGFEHRVGMFIIEAIGLCRVGVGF
jgi:hypothetical protein